MNDVELMNAPHTKKGVTGLTIKVIAIVTMFMDHFAAVLLEGYLGYLYDKAPDLGNGQGLLPNHPEIFFGRLVFFLMRGIGRFGFPLFIFLLIEGFTHTRSKAKYARNLAIFALISEIPFNLAVSNKLINLTYQNVFFTLFLGLLCIWMIDKFAYNREWSVKFVPLNYLASLVLGGVLGYLFTLTTICGLLQKLVKLWGLFYCIAGAVITLIVHLIVSRKWDAERKTRYAVTALITAVFALAAALLMTDYGGAGIVTIVVMYLFRAKKKKAFALGCVVLAIDSFFEAMAFLMLIPVAKYNGERGKPINKYLFYAFYPVHLGLLYLTGYLLGFLPFAIK